MYAVVNTGGKQYKVGKGDILRVEKLTGDVGSPVVFDKVLLFSDGETLRIGKPYIADLTVNGTVVEQNKHKKIIVFKYKRRKRYKRKQGHRQPFTAVKIDDFLLGGVESQVDTNTISDDTTGTEPQMTASTEPENAVAADQTEQKGA